MTWNAFAFLNDGFKKKIVRFNYTRTTLLLDNTEREQNLLKFLYIQDSRRIRTDIWKNPSETTWD